MGLRDGERSEYEWPSEAPAHNHSYLVPALLKQLGPANGRRLFDIGCGNGALSARLAEAGFEVMGMESSVSGVETARRSYPDLDFILGNVEASLPVSLTREFDVVLAAEVIEHLFKPRDLLHRMREAVRPGGLIVVTTPYHGYLKNLALAVTGKFDEHWRPGWDYGHIKFFSINTLTQMCVEVGIGPGEIVRVGRIAPLAKSMIFSARH